MTATGPGDSPLQVFDEARPRLFGIAYRMLGSVSEAEDIVQEAWIRWQGTEHAAVRNPQGFLTTITTRLAINSAESARARRETYIGPWLPEPVDTADDPTLGAETAEAVEAAVLVLLEKLPARERAAYVLREAFDYPYEQIAEILSTSGTNARQVVSRARKHLDGARAVRVDSARLEEFLTLFVAAAQGGDLDALEALLTRDVVSASDGAGIAPRAARRPVIGRDKVARFVAGFASTFWAGTETSWVTANGAPAVLVSRHGEPEALLSIEASSEGIHHVMWVMAPAKLTRMGLFGGSDGA